MLRTFPDFRDLVGYQTVCFPVYGDGRLLVRRLDEAKDFACAFVKPVLLIIHALLLPHFEVARVRACDGFLGKSFHVMVNVHIERHCTMSPLASVKKLQPSFAVVLVGLLVEEVVGRVGHKRRITDVC